MGWSWNLGPSVSILLRVDEPRHPRVINCVKGAPPWSKEKEEKEMRDVVHENANLAGKACCCVLSFGGLELRASITPNRGGFLLEVGRFIQEICRAYHPSIHRPRLVTL